MKCRYGEESNLFGQPANCKLTGGVCGICNNGDYSFCKRIAELEDGYVDLLELLRKPATTKDDARAFIKQFIKVG